jgi:hypothetical protein
MKSLFLLTTALVFLFEIVRVEGRAATFKDDRLIQKSGNKNDFFNLSKQTQSSIASRIFAITSKFECLGLLIV